MSKSNNSIFKKVTEISGADVLEKFREDKEHFQGELKQFVILISMFLIHININLNCVAMFKVWVFHQLVGRVRTVPSSITILRLKQIGRLPNQFTKLYNYKFIPYTTQVSHILIFSLELLGAEFCPSIHKLAFLPFF